MRSYSFHFSFDHIPMVMTRKRHAMLVLVNQKGQYVLGKKDAYPEGISRFVGGGIDEGEDAAVGVARELQEELGVVVAPSALIPLAHLINTVSLPDKPDTMFETFLYGYVLHDEVLQSADDLDGIAYLNSEEMEQLIARFASLPTDLVSPKGGDAPFRWSDYGNFAAKVHRIGVDEMCEWWKTQKTQ